MWICQQCHTENSDAAPSCEACGTPRAAGRFASAPVQRPAVWSAQPPAVTQAPRRQANEAPAPPRGAAQPQSASAPPKRKKGNVLSAFARFVGMALLILLPLLTAALAYRQYESLSALLSPLLAGDPLPKGAQLGCYLAFAIAAVLLSALPGLWTLLLAKKRDDPGR